MVKTNHFMLFLGSSLGYHADIITLNGNLPPAYEDLSVKYNTPLALRRSGLSIDPMMRLFWYPIRMGSVLQIGITGGAGYAVDQNSKWRLGYYSDEHGKYDHFKKLSTNPTTSKKSPNTGSSSAPASACGSTCTKTLRQKPLQNKNPHRHGGSISL